MLCPNLNSRQINLSNQSIPALQPPSSARCTRWRCRWSAGRTGRAGSRRPRVGRSPARSRMRTSLPSTEMSRQKSFIMHYSCCLRTFTLSESNSVIVGGLGGQRPGSMTAFARVTKARTEITDLIMVDVNLVRMLTVGVSMETSVLNTHACYLKSL